MDPVEDGCFVTILNDDKVDYLGTDPRDGRTYLVITDHLTWENEREHLELLQRKLNWYLEFVTSGQIYQSFPDARGTPLVIRVNGKFELPEVGVRYFCEARKQTQFYGVDLVHEFRP